MLKIEIETETSAFRDPRTGEKDNQHEEQNCSCLLKTVADQIYKGQREGIILDIDGNNVGKWSM